MNEKLIETLIRLGRALEDWLDAKTELMKMAVTATKASAELADALAKNERQRGSS